MRRSRALGGASDVAARQVTGQQKRSCTPASARAPCGEGSHRAPREAGEQPEKSCATSSTGYSALVEQALHPCSSSSRLASRGPGGPKRVWNRRLGGGWLGRQRQRMGRPYGPASSPESAEPPRAARGGEAPGPSLDAAQRGVFGHAARADELAQLGASQHHLALSIFVVRGGDAVGAHALAERVGVRRQQLLQPHAIEAAAL